jgi:hypothetical protein
LDWIKPRKKCSKFWSNLTFSWKYFFRYIVENCIHGRRGAVDIASASGTEDPGSNPTTVWGFQGNIEMLHYIIDLTCIVWVWKIEIKEMAKKDLRRQLNSHKNWKGFSWMEGDAKIIGV